MRLSTSPSHLVARFVAAAAVLALWIGVGIIVGAALWGVLALFGWNYDSEPDLFGGFIGFFPGAIHAGRILITGELGLPKPLP